MPHIYFIVWPRRMKIGQIENDSNFTNWFHKTKNLYIKNIIIMSTKLSLPDVSFSS